MSVVYITGASAGLGHAIAQTFSKAGHTIGLISRDEEALRQTAEEIGGKTSYAVADVSIFEQLETAARQLEAAIGPPDIWINSAMATIFSRFIDVAPDEFEQATNITYLGSAYGLKIALKMMEPRKHGHIIQIGSALAYRAIPLQACYCAAKMAVRGAVDSLRCELIHDKSPLRITMVHMPAMNTPQFDWARRHIAIQPQPVPPIYAPEACAQAVLWASEHPARREVWVGKPTFQAIIANKIFPALMDYYMAHRAYEGQFEKPGEQADTQGNLFTPVKGIHSAEGHFSSRQSEEVFWFGTSWWQELLMAGGLLVILLVVLYCVVRGL